MSFDDRYPDLGHLLVYHFSIELLSDAELLRIREREMLEHFDQKIVPTGNS